jgi:hypothetical protein
MPMPTPQHQPPRHHASAGVGFAATPMTTSPANATPAAKRLDHIGQPPEQLSSI